MRKKAFLASIIALLALATTAFADYPFSAQDYANAKASGQYSGQFANSAIGSKSGVQSRIIAPGGSNGAIPMYTLDNSQSFNASFTGPSGKPIVGVFIHPTSSGDLSPVIISENTGDGSNWTYTYKVPFAISGVCSNGVIACDPGTWNNCKYFQWVADSSANVSLQQVPPGVLGSGCYCVNRSCGYDLATRNLSIVLQDIGGGVTGAVMASGNYQMTIAGVQQDSATITYYGQIVKNTASNYQPPSYVNQQDMPQYEWQTGSSMPSMYYNSTNGGYLFAAAGSEEASEQSNPNSMYNLIANSNAAKTNPVSQNTCYINQVLGIDKKQDDYYTGVGGSGAPYDATQCQSISNCYTDNGTQYCDCYFAPTGVGYCGCGQSYSYNIDGKWVFYAYSPDDYNFIIQVNGQIIATTGGCYETSGDDPFGATYTGTNTGHIYAAVGNGGSCNGLPSSYFKALIKKQAWDLITTSVLNASSYITPPDQVQSVNVDDQCQAYENDPNCQLQDEWVDGVRTWSNYASTGLLPTGQTCKQICGWTCHTICSNWWQKKRIYACKMQSFDFSGIKQRVNTIAGSVANTDVMSGNVLNSVNYQDYRQYSNGSWGPDSGSVNIPYGGNTNGCMNVCKVKVPEQDTQAESAQGTNTSQYRSINSYIFDYRKCDDNNNCPVDTSAGESIVVNCSCIDEFAEAASILQSLQEAGKDIICSSGTPH